MSNINQTPGYRGEAAHPEEFSQAATGAESTYVHGGQRPLENPPKGAGKDVSPVVQDQLSEMHVDSKLSAQSADGQEVMSDEQKADLDRRRAEGFKMVDDKAIARQERAKVIADTTDAVRDRTLAVQEEIATRERDGAMPGTAAFARRQDRIREIIGETKDGEDDRPVADRLSDIAARLHLATPGGIEEAQHELMEIAAEIRGDKPHREYERERVVA